MQSIPPNRFAIAAGILAFVPLLTMGKGAEAQSNVTPPQRESVVPPDPAGSTHPAGSSGWIDFTMPATDGKVAWREVARLAAQSMTLDQPSVERMLPAGDVNLDSPLAGLVLTGINLASDGAFTLEKQTDINGRQTLRVRCRREWLQPIAEPIAMKPCVCDWDADLADRGATRPIVVLLHGYQGSPAAWNDFREHLRAKGYATATIGYDGDLPLAETAKQVALVVQRELRSFESGIPGSSVPPWGDRDSGTNRDLTRLPMVLVGHSMGGLIARQWTENSELPGHSIVGLITLGTPHGGSNWATLPPMSNLFTGNDFDGTNLIDLLLHQNSSEGLKDLIPGSAFLEQLTTRGRRPDVAYTTIVGNQSPLAQADVAVLRGTLRSLDQEGSWMRLIRPRIQPLMGSFDELSNGKGDGMVACPNAMIDDCDDVITLPVTHFEMVGRSIPIPATVLPATEPNPVWRAVTDRLEKITR